jgi:hypothetical protein
MIGFTGTAHGKLTRDQVASLVNELYLAYRSGMWLGTGEAEQADMIANDAARRLGYHTRGYPTLISEHRVTVDERRPAKPPLDRNRDIVADCSRLIACPRGPERSYPRSGTWATVRYARAAGKPVTIIWPDGRVES